MSSQQTEKEIRHDVLCQCGWGQLAMREEDIPEHCPVCGFNFWEYAGDAEWEEV